MKKIILLIVIILVIVLAYWLYQNSPVNTVVVNQATTTTQTSQSNLYTSARQGFSITLPKLATSSTDTTGYVVNETYSYDALGPGKEIAGTSFKIPSNMTVGTNLSTDTYISVEHMPQATSCTPLAFLGQSSNAPKTLKEGSVTYLVA